MSAITLCDVAPRDGLQNRAEIVEPAVRAELVDRLAATGLPRIEAVSFVSASRVPQMAGAEEVVAGITPRAGVTVAGLVLNERGYDRLVAAGLREAHFSFAVSESFNRRNQGASVEESLAAAASIIGRARKDGISSTVTLSTAFGCPFEGQVDPGLVADIAARVVDAGPDEVLLADTIGVAVPRQVGALVADSREAPGSRRRASAQHAQHGICERTGRPRRPARLFSTRHSVESEAARSLPGRRATSPPRIWSTSSTARGSRPESISMR